MSKAVLISIRPEWCEKIVTGQKTIEVRKTRPKMNPPFKCYIYKCGSGKVIGEFVCDEIISIDGAGRIQSDIARPTCLEPAELHRYLGAAVGYGWHISNLKIYDHPCEVSSFRGACKNDWWCESCAMYSERGGTCRNAGLQITRPPQSWRYVEEELWNG